MPVGGRKGSKADSQRDRQPANKLITFCCFVIIMVCFKNSNKQQLRKLRESCKIQSTSRNSRYRLGISHQNTKMIFAGAPISGLVGMLNWLGTAQT